MMLAAYKYPFLAFHLLSVIAWMAGLLYLPRLFIYHLEFEVGSHPYQVFCRMERRLLRIIMLPACLATLISGTLLAFAAGTWGSPWFHAKIMLVFLLGICHSYFARVSREYREGHLPDLSRFSLIVLNEIPFLLAILIVCLAVLKPR